jgi:hypothetical protein
VNFISEIRVTLDCLWSPCAIRFVSRSIFRKLNNAVPRSEIIQHKIYNDQEWWTDQDGSGCDVRRCIQKFPDWPPGRTANGTAVIRCSFIATLWVSLVSFVAMLLISKCCTVVVYNVIDSVRKVLDILSYSDVLSRHHHWYNDEDTKNILRQPIPSSTFVSSRDVRLNITVGLYKVLWIRPFGLFRFEVLPITGSQLQSKTWEFMQNSNSSSVSIRIYGGV